jgi:tetratricopeptide (TPR) repeat protein
MIILGDALAAHSPNWLEERITLSESDRNQRDEKIAKERKDLYEFAFNKSVDIQQKIKATLKFATVLSSESDTDEYSAELFRSAIKLSSNHFGAYSEETLECVEEFLGSNSYNASDLDVIYHYHNFLKEKKGYSGFDNYSDISEFCESIGNLEFALSFQEDALEERRQHEPLWFIYENASNYDDLCDLYIKLKCPMKAVDFLDSLIDSYINIQPHDQSPAREETLKSLRDLKQQITSIINQGEQKKFAADLHFLLKKTCSTHLIYDL